MRKFMTVVLLVAICGVLLYWHYRNSVGVGGVDEQIVVDFKDDVSQDYIKELGKKLNVQFVPVSKYSAVDKVYVGHYSGDDEDDVINALNKDDEVEAADRDTIVSIPENEAPFEVIK